MTYTNNGSIDNVTTVHQEALKAFVEKEYRRAWTLCLQFMSRPSDGRPLWIEVYILRLQAYLMPSNVNAFMDDALRACDEIEKTFEVQEPAEKDLYHLEQLRQHCEGHKKCFQTKETMDQTLLKKEVGAMDLGDIFDDAEFQKWAREEMEGMFEWDTFEDTVNVNENGKEEVEHGSSEELNKQVKDSLGSRLLRLEDVNKQLVGSFDKLVQENKRMLAHFDGLIEGNRQLKARIKAIEVYTTECYERDQISLQLRDEEHDTRRAQFLGGVEPGVSNVPLRWLPHEAIPRPVLVRHRQGAAGRWSNWQRRGKGKD